MSHRRLALLFVAPLVVLLAWAALGWYPQHQRHDSASARVEEAEKLNDDAQLMLAAARKTAATADATAASLAQLKRQLPDDPDLGGFVLMNQSIAAKSAVVINDITPQTGIEERFLPGAIDLPATLKPTVVNITGTGSFDAVWTYVQLLTKADRLVVIDTIALDTAELGVIRCDLSVRIFSNRPKVTPDPTASVQSDTVTAAVPK